MAENPLGWERSATVCEWFHDGFCRSRPNDALSDSRSPVSAKLTLKLLWREWFQVQRRSKEKKKGKIEAFEERMCAGKRWERSPRKCRQPARRHLEPDAQLYLALALSRLQSGKTAQLAGALSRCFVTMTRLWPWIEQTEKLQKKKRNEFVLYWVSITPLAFYRANVPSSACFCQLRY